MDETGIAVPTLSVVQSVSEIVLRLSALADCRPAAVI